MEESQTRFLEWHSGKQNLESLHFLYLNVYIFGEFYLMNCMICGLYWLELLKWCYVVAEMVILLRCGS